MPNIRPNCPPPKRPIVEPGGISVSMHSNLKRSGTEFKNSRVKNQGVRSNPRASARERFEKKLSLGGQRQVSQKLLTRMMRASSGKKLLPKFLSRSQESELRSQELQNGTADRP